MNCSAKVEEPARASEISSSQPSCTVDADRGYERWAPIYDESPNPLLAREERHLLPIVENLHPTRVLDLACGTGRWLQQLEPRCAARFGIDRSAAMLHVAGGKPATSGRIVQADCVDLPFADATFDLAICSFAIGHIDDLGRMAQELARVTTPNGNLFISDLHPDAYRAGWRVGFRDGSSAVEIAIVPRLTEEIIEAFRIYGLQCQAHASLRLGDPERIFFERAGKSGSFQQATQVPAILMLQFTKIPDSAWLGA